MSTIETPTAPTLPATLRLGATHLTVSNLDGSIAFYERSVGLQLHDRDGNRAALGAGGEDLLVLVEQPGAGLGGSHAGLYHFALLFDSREELARAIRRLAETRTRIEGASDHGVSEAIYLRDPDDNGIELYVDRPREDWPPPRQPGERVEMYTIALDIQALTRHGRGRGDPRARRPGPAHGPPAPARRRRRARPGLLPRRARLRGHGEPRQRRVRLRGRLPPPPRLQRLARLGRQAQAARTSPACATGPCSSTAPTRSPRCARASRRRACRPSRTTAASSSATRGRPPSRSPSRPQRAMPDVAARRRPA